MWSSQCAQCSCSSKLSWESSHAVHYSPRPIHWIGGVGFISCRDTGLQRHITPLPVLIPRQYLHHTSMEQRSQALLFPPTLFLTHQPESHRFLQFFQHQTRNPGFFYITFFPIKEIYLTSKKLETPESIPSTLLPWIFQYFTSFWLFNT